MFDILHGNFEDILIFRHLKQESPYNLKNHNKNKYLLI